MHDRFFSPAAELNSHFSYQELRHSAQSLGFNAEINGLRGLSILLVFFHHVLASPQSAGLIGEPVRNNALAYFLDHAQYGVELFFMISGYLIVNSLIRHDHVGRFLLDRCIRIYPPFLVIHLLVFAVGPFIAYKFLADVGPFEWIGHFFSNLAFLPGITELPQAQPVAWSLAYEAVFYFVASLGFVLLRGTRPAIAWMMLLPLVAGLIVVFPRMIFFVVGVVTYFFGRNVISGSKAFDMPLVWVVIFLFLWNVPSDHGQELTLDWYIGQSAWRNVVAVAASFMAFVSIVHGRGILSALLRTRVFQFLGNISYSFYLWHTLVIFAFKPVLAKGLETGVFGSEWVVPLIVVVCLPVATAVSTASYVYVEKKGAKWLKERLALRPKSRRLPTEESAANVEDDAQAVEIR